MSDSSVIQNAFQRLFPLHGITLILHPTEINLLRGAIENAEGEAAVQCVWRKASGPVSWIQHGECFVAPLLLSLLMADGVTLYTSPGFLVPRFRRL